MGTRIISGSTLLAGLGIAASSTVCSFVASPTFLLGIPIGLVFISVGAIGILPTTAVPTALRERWLLLFSLPIGILFLLLSALTANVSGVIAGAIAIAGGAVAFSSSQDIRKRLQAVAILFIAALMILVGVGARSLVLSLTGVNFALAGVAFADIIPPRGVTLAGRAATAFQYTIGAPLVIGLAFSLGLLITPIAATLLVLSIFTQIIIQAWAWLSYSAPDISQSDLAS